MPIDPSILCRQIEPENTVLLFGAGSSIPSGGMSGAHLAERIADHFTIDYDPSLSLSDVATIVERRYTRPDLISYVRSLISNLAPTGSLLNLPLYDWKSIYTTNYDLLIEKAYARAQKTIVVYRSNFDFSIHGQENRVRLYKLHGSIEEDVSDGKNSRIVISTRDYDDTSEYRQLLYSAFELEISTANFVIIGHSLSDPDLKTIIDEALRRKRHSGAPGKIFLLIYSANRDRALIYEERGIEVCFSNLDGIFSELNRKLPATRLVASASDDPLDVAPGLRPSTIDVSHALNSVDADVHKMFNGRPATYGDIAADFTFNRDVSNLIEAQLAQGPERVVYLLGAAGVGKSTASRQAMARLSERGIYCWEHKDDFALSSGDWYNIATALRKRGELGVLFVDNCHWHLREINNLLQSLERLDMPYLRLMLASTRHHWNPRTKSPIIFAHGAR
jgi:hypothetical protein